MGYDTCSGSGVCSSRAEWQRLCVCVRQGLLRLVDGASSCREGSKGLVEGHHHHLGLQGESGVGPCDADDAPVLPQGSEEQPADEPAFWNLRQAHQPWFLVSI